MAATRPTRRGERGSAAVEFALAVPMLLSVLATLVQLFSWGMAHLAAQAAADRAAQTARVAGGTPRAGRAEARELLAQLPGGFLVDPAVTVTRTPTRTTVAVCGAARGIPLPVAVTVSSPTERYTTP